MSELLVREDTQLVTLVGPGGVGKTRLARQIAPSMSGSFPDGVAFVSLEPIRSVDLVLPVIARALGIGDSGQSNVLNSLIVELATNRLLLVLDNVEQVIEVALNLAQLLAACPRLTMLVTSREPLRLASELEFSVVPLPLPAGATASTLEDIAASAAVQLFVQRARSVQPAFDLTSANAWDIARICQRLDGLPLAIELAAARTKILSPHALLSHLGAPLSLLVGGARDAPSRQRTMRDAIAWSYDLLTPDEQAIFRRLGIFVGGFTLEAAMQVVDETIGSSVAVLDLLASLVDRSLVVPMTDGSEPRFVMLETIREYALEQLGHAGEAEEARRAHAIYFRDLAEQAEPALRGAAQPAWIARLETELPNLRAVLDWSLAGGDVETGLRLAGALYWFWFLRNHVGEGRAWFERARTAGSRLPAAAGRAAAGAALLAWRAADYVASKAGALTEAILAAAAPGDVLGVDPSAEFLGAARARIADPRVRFAVGDARALPVTSDAYDAVVAGLVLNFVPEPGAAVAEMVRAARPGGAVGAYVWDYAGGMQMVRAFWRAAVALDPAAAAWDQARQFPLCRPEPLAALFRDAGLGAVEVGAVDGPTTFRDLDDYWRPHLLGGPGVAQRYVAALAEAQRAALRDRLRATLPVAADGSIPLIARAWAVRGTKAPEAGIR